MAPRPRDNDAKPRRPGGPKQSRRRWLRDARELADRLAPGSRVGAGGRADLGHVHVAATVDGDAVRRDEVDWRGWIVAPTREHLTLLIKHRYARRAVKCVRRRLPWVERG